MSKLMVIPNKKEDINIILNKDIEGINCLNKKDRSPYFINYEHIYPWTNENLEVDLNDYVIKKKKRHDTTRQF